MSQTQYATPVLVSQDGSTSALLTKVPIAGSLSEYDEAYIQEVAFRHPKCLPVSEIDRAFESLIPVCKELNTPAGPLDILFVTPTGRLAVVEAKLWRNPEARRKVIGQILDYAKELSRWDYEDLQREVSRATGRKGNVLYDLVAEQHPETSESDFVDEVTRCLTRGRFLLMILGDGIREGVEAIAQFLEEVGRLEFVLGLIELGIYRCPDRSTLIQPRVLAKTTIFNRTVISLADGTLKFDDQAEKEEDEELSPSAKFYRSFWPELLQQLKLDDPSQPYPNSRFRSATVFFPMPPSGSQSWVTCYFSQASREAGVFLTFARGAVADETYEKLVTEKEEIDKELGIDVKWSSIDGKHRISSSRIYDDLLADRNRENILEYFKDTINRFVNAFRPRLEKITNESGIK